MSGKMLSVMTPTSEVSASLSPPRMAAMAAAASRTRAFDSSGRERGTASTLMAVGLGYLVGGAYDGTLLPMAVGFAVLTSIASALTAWYEAPSRRARVARKKYSNL